MLPVEIFGSASPDEKPFYKTVQKKMDTIWQQMCSVLFSWSSNFFGFALALYRFVPFFSPLNVTHLVFQWLFMT